MTSKTNRNLWTKSEDSILLEYVRTARLISTGFEKASLKLGRSIRACDQRFYKHLNGKADKNESGDTKNANKIKIIVHNGVSQAAKILVQTSDMIIAQYRDIIIQINLNNEEENDRRRNN